MTFAQYAALVDGHNSMYGGKRRRGRVEMASHADIAALKNVRVSNA